MPRVRDSLRLQGYDYSSPGTYFVTICAYRRELVFEEPAVEDVIESAWTSIPQHFSGTQIDAFVVMPNHFHGHYRVKR
ncbi:MAG TPA: hypothetical protein VFY10_12525 [Dehalococcoidia bacterium]|nr:hypothetical protein [Dehalococcoidia bacterium]